MPATRADREPTEGRRIAGPRTHVLKAHQLIASCNMPGGVRAARQVVRHLVRRYPEYEIDLQLALATCVAREGKARRDGEWVE